MLALPGRVGQSEIALALSGGGVRAAVFHLGVLKRLAEWALLEKVTFLSTVSGGSLITGLIYSLSGNRWPSSETFLTSVLPRAETILTLQSLQGLFAGNVARHPWTLAGGRANVLAQTLEKHWRLAIPLKDIATRPRWIINATTYESGKNWRFMPQRMGDYVLGYVAAPRITLADAVAASSAFPGLVGPFAINTADFDWANFDKSGHLVPAPRPFSKVLHLWDGGLYDNLGVEALFKNDGRGYREGFGFLIVSDGSSPLSLKRKFWPTSGMRLLDISGSQVRGLRARSLVDYFRENNDNGVYLRLGNTSAEIDKVATLPHRVELSAVLDESAVDSLSTMGTHLLRISPSRFGLLSRHGWEVADATFAAYISDESHRGTEPARPPTS